MCFCAMPKDTEAFFSSEFYKTLERIHMKRCIVITAMLVVSVCCMWADDYKLEKVNGKYLCRGEVVCKKSDNATFGATVLWALGISKNENGQGAAQKFDTQAMRLIIKPAIIPEGTTEHSYTCLMTIAVMKGKLNFLIEKVKCVPNNVLGTFTAISLDKINLEKKPQHKALIEEFELTCQKFVKGMLDDILNRDINLDNWEAISKGQVVKGMDKDEVMMAIGKPRDITENTQRVMWTYDSGKIVVFENGKVTGILN